MNNYTTTTPPPALRDTPSLDDLRTTCVREARQIVVREFGHLTPLLGESLTYDHLSALVLVCALGPHLLDLLTAAAREQARQIGQPWPSPEGF